MKVAIAQINCTVGDFDGNAAKMLRFAAQAREAGASIMVTPELGLSGYIPEDLLLREDFCQGAAAALERMAAQVRGITVVVGFPEQMQDERYNSAAVLRDGRVIGIYRKQRLPNHTVFDEVRYFTPGLEPMVFDEGGVTFGVNICADVWHEGSASSARAAGADVLLVLNASPYHINKQPSRYEVVRDRIRESGLSVVYCNLVGGQDELVFDGASFAMNRHGQITAQFAAFEETLAFVTLEKDGPVGAMVPALSEEAIIYRALCVGVKDYVEKNGFPGVELGLSGGIDSALTLAVAVDALGADRVHAVMMASQFTADISLEDARVMAEQMGVRYSEIPIKPMFDSFLASLADDFDGLPFDTTEENIQARIRGTLLMAMSNKYRTLVLTTGNKSEMAVGYATLYGDMAGGFAVLKDVSKTRVYRLARYRNAISPVIPERVIVRAPSAELRADQTDQDALPPYDVLDAIMEMYVEQDAAPADIVAAGYGEADVRKVVRLINLSEYKRRQAPVGVRVTGRGFGRDRRYPITSRFEPRYD